MTHIKVYKTDVDNRLAAESILDDIQKLSQNCDVNFDLEDCDNVLRVENLNGPVDDAAVKTIVSAQGHHIERLPLH